MPGLYAAVFVITRVAGVCSSPVDPWLTNFICAMSPQNICICISNPLYLCLVADIFVKGGKAPAPCIICQLPVNMSGTNPEVNNLVGKFGEQFWSSLIFSHWYWTSKIIKDIANTECCRLLAELEECLFKKHRSFWTSLSAFLCFDWTEKWQPYFNKMALLILTAAK